MEFRQVGREGKERRNSEGDSAGQDRPWQKVGEEEERVNTSHLFPPNPFPQPSLPQFRILLCLVWFTGCCISILPPFPISNTLHFLLHHVNYVPNAKITLTDVLLKILQRVNFPFRLKVTHLCLSQKLPQDFPAASGLVSTPAYFQLGPYVSCQALEFA